VTGDQSRLAAALFDGERLSLARLYRGLQKVDVAKQLGLTPAAIGQYEQGRTRPSAAVVAALALHLRFPPSFFERGRPLFRVSEGQAHFRRLRSTSKRDRDRLLARVGLLAEIVADVEQHVHLPKVSIPEIPGAGMGDEEGVAAESAAAEVRKVWGLGSGPIDHVVRLLETKGVIVVRPAIDTTEVDAFSTVVAGRPIVVLASDKQDAARSRMDAAHELGHLVMHHDAEPGRQSVEREAQRFAAAFLLPREPILAELPKYMQWEAYFSLKARWRVSLAALLYRARSLGVLGPDAYQRAQIRLSARGWREREPVDIGVPEEPRLLQRALDLLAARQGRASVAIASGLRLFNDDFAQLLADVTSRADRPPTLTVVEAKQTGRTTTMNAETSRDADESYRPR
jgi:Zn-dependent peptidase ImmA (M78 family)/transcriptional regulator with XRE-family HTH domain